MLIVGGDGKNSVEVFSPVTGKGCLLPDHKLPTDIEGATLNTLSDGSTTLLCGGRKTKNKCLQFTPHSSTQAWKQSSELGSNKSFHVSWLNEDDEVVLLGGWYSYGDVEEATGKKVLFSSVETDVRLACSIQQESSVIITGGLYNNNETASSRVISFNKEVGKTE